MLPRIKRLSGVARLVAVTAGLTLSLGACSGLPVGKKRTDQLDAAERQQLNNSLNVASASADAGQLEAAERLYTQLSRHFPGAPEPRLGLGYLALEAGDFTLAEQHFIEAHEKSATPAAKAEALLGAGRTSLGKGDAAEAKNHFLAASKVAKGTAVEAWVANGLGVVATLEGDHAGARIRHEEAFELSPSHPMITANLVRALAQSGAGNEARQLYAEFPASHWLDGDGTALSSLLKNEKGAATTSGATVQLYSARSRDGALAAWNRISSEEKELLGSLTHRIVKAEVPKRGVFYRLRAGPLPDRAAAIRLCVRLKGRGRDCFVPAGKWAGGDGRGMATAGKDADAQGGGAHRTTRSRPPAVTQKPPPRAPEAEGTAAAGAKVQLFSARSREGALAAWGRLSSEEKELLGSLAHRVVKAELPKRGAFYRLRAGPLANKAAAKRLCARLKGRGRDCLVLAGKWLGGGATGEAETSPEALPGRPTEAAGSPPVTEGASRETPEAAAIVSGARVQLFSARSRDRALAAWGRLSSEEKELLGSLTHRVVEARIPKRGVFYRLSAGPLADNTAARRLCGLLKGRGRDCFVPAGK